MPSWHELILASQVVFSPLCFLPLFLSFPAAAHAASKFTLVWQLLVCSPLTFPELTHTPTHPHVCVSREKYIPMPLPMLSPSFRKRGKKGRVRCLLWISRVCAAAPFYWWLPIANSKVSLSFDSLICIGSLSQRDAVYQCPQAECQHLLSAYKYPADTVCHVYSWTSLTFDNTLDISHQNFTLLFL